MNDEFERTQHALKKILRKPLFFIVGGHKSGTTWLKTLLNGHPRVCSQGESCFFDILSHNVRYGADLYNQQQEQVVYNVFTDAHKDFLHRTAMALLISRWPSIDDATCIVEKDPNIGNDPSQVQRLYPDAKYIHIIRDGRDVAVSSWFWGTLQSPKPKWLDAYADDFHGFVAFWTTTYWMPYVTTWLAFGSQRPECYYELRYEDLLREPDHEIAGLLQFLGVDTSRSALDACLEAGAFARLAGGRDNGDEDRSSFFRKGIAGDWRNHFDDAALAVFNARAGKLMHVLGYTD